MEEMSEESQQTLIDTTEPSEAPNANSTSAKKEKWNPHNPDLVIKYDADNFWKKEEGTSSDVYQLVAVSIGLFSFTFAQKWAFWLALFFYYTSCINTVSVIRIRQILTGVTITFMGFINMYIRQDVPIYVQEFPDLPEIPDL